MAPGPGSVGGKCGIFVETSPSFWTVDTAPRGAEAGDGGDAVTTDEFGGLGTFVAMDHSRSVYPVLDPHFHEGSLARWSLRWVYGSSATGVVWFYLYNRSSLSACWLWPSRVELN